MLTLMMGIILILFRMYGLDTHHETRSSIWWPERLRNLIPAAATNITLQRDILDHCAIYTISEKDLNTYLNGRFSSDGEKLDSFSEREIVGSETIGDEIGPLGWVITKDMVVYEYYASNGGNHTYYYSPASGRAYQSSAYW